MTVNRLSKIEIPKDSPSINVVLVPDWGPPRIETVPLRQDIFMVLLGRPKEEDIAFEPLSDGNTAWYADPSSLPEDLDPNYLIELQDDEFFGSVDAKHRWVYDKDGERKIYRGAFLITGPVQAIEGKSIPGTIAEFSARKYLKELG